MYIIPQIFDYVEAVGRGLVSIIIEPATKQREKAAIEEAAQHKLFSVPEPEDSDEDGEKDAEGDSPTEDETPSEDEPQDLKGPALASWREIHGNKPRVPARKEAE